MPEGENVGFWECFISLTCLCLQVDNEKLSHALLCLFTSVCLGFSKAFLIICYWHSCGTIFDLSENDIIIAGIKRPRLHFPLRQMKRQMGKIKNSIWRAKHTFRHTHKHALIVNLIPRVLDQVWSWELYSWLMKEVSLLYQQMCCSQTHKHTHLLIC